MGYLNEDGIAVIKALCDETYGDYEKIIVGSAEQLLSTEYTADSVPYKFRANPTSADRAEEEIVGGTVAWNQLVQNGNFASSSGWGGNNASISVASNKCTLTPTASNATVALRNAGLNGVANHKIFCAMTVTSSKATTCAFYVGGGSTTARPISVSANTRTMVADIVIPTTATGGAYFYCNRGSTLGTSDTCIYENVFTVDLTQMFGTTVADYIYSLEQSTAGAGVAWFKKYFPNDYYAYNAGELISVGGLSSHDTVGFNQWDEEWEVGGIDNNTGQNTVGTTNIRSKDYIRILPNTAYYYCSSAWSAFYYYDANKNFTERKVVFSAKHEFTPPSNACYMRFLVSTDYGTTYKNDICINLSGERNGEYEPYQKHSYPLDSSLTLRGIPKLADGKMYYDGDIYASDGTVTRRYGIVDLGTLTWTQPRTSEFRCLFSTMSQPPKPASAGNVTANIICPKYTTITADGTYTQNQGIALSASSSPYISVYDSSYTDAATFKTAMSGVYLVYELATPTTESATPYQQIQNVGSTEEYVSTTITPVGHNTKYFDNLRKKIEGLPWDLSMLAPIENGTKASQAYAVGAYFMHNNQFCKAKTAIASGATFTLNTNYTVTTVGAELYSALH